MNPIRFLSLALVFVFVSVAFMPVMAQSNTFLNQTFTVPGGSDTCNYQYTYIYNASGSSIVGTIKVSQGKIDFFILTQSEYDAFTHNSRRGATCAVLRAEASELTEIGIINYSVHYTVPDNSNHYFVFLNSYLYDAIVTATLSWS